MSLNSENLKKREYRSFSGGKNESHPAALRLVRENLSSINTRKFWPKKPNICQLQKNIVHRYRKKKSFDRACWTPIHFPSIFLLEKKFHAQHLSCGYFDFWPKMYGTNLVFSEKINRTSNWQIAPLCTVLKATMQVIYLFGLLRIPITSNFKHSGTFY